MGPIAEARVLEMLERIEGHLAKLVGALRVASPQVVSKHRLTNAEIAAITASGPGGIVVLDKRPRTLDAAAMQRDHAASDRQARERALDLWLRRRDMAPNERQREHAEDQVQRLQREIAALNDRTDALVRRAGVGVE